MLLRDLKRSIADDERAVSLANHVLIICDNEAEWPVRHAGLYLGDICSCINET
jgi:hypothetical protein